MEWLRTITTARTSIRTQLFSGAFTSVDLDSGAGFNQPIAVEAEL
jgi:hypothetical protein